MFRVKVQVWINMFKVSASVRDMVRFSVSVRNRVSLTLLL